MRRHETGAGLVTLEDLRRQFAAPQLTTNLKAILITLGWWTPEDDTELPRKGHGYKPGTTPQELYDSTRAWWVMGERRTRYSYAVAVFQGITRAVWEDRPQELDAVELFSRRTNKNSVVIPRQTRT